MSAVPILEAPYVDNQGRTHYDVSFVGDGDWHIFSAQRELPAIPGFLGSHNYYIEIDGTGKIVAELDGSYSGQFTMGPTEGNYLAIYELQGNDFDVGEPLTGDPTEILTGPEELIASEFDDAYNTIKAYTDPQTLLYAGAGLLTNALNSNSVWYTIGRIWGLDPSTYEGPATAPGDTIDIRSVPSNVASATAPESFTQFVSGIAGAIANQLIQTAFRTDPITSTSLQVLDSAALGFLFGKAGTYSIDGEAITGSELFAADLGSQLVTLVGGQEGAKLGTDFFKALGLPPEIGAAIGSDLGSVGTKEIAAAVAENLFNGFKVSIPTSSLLETAGAGSLGSLLGGELAQSIADTTGPGASIGDAIGNVIGYAIGTWIPVVGTTVFTFLGSFLGSLIGGLFGPKPSVGPNGLGEPAISNGQFVVGVVAVDNGGDINIPQDMTTAAVNALNAILTNIGGVLVSAPRWQFGYFKGQYVTEPAADYPNYTYRYDDAAAAVQYGVLQLAHEMQISGGDPYVKMAISNTDAGTLDQLSSDIGAAKSYEAFIANPAAFDAALAASGDENLYAEWTTALARAQALGLDNLANEQQTIVQIYRNILQRQPDASEISGWLNAFLSGDTTSEIRQGIVALTETQQKISTMYEQVLGRAATTDELGSWSAFLNGGGTLSQIRASASTTQEAQGNIERLYERSFGRVATIDEIANGVVYLANGGTLNALKVSLANLAAAAGAVALSDFAWQQGWGRIDTPRMILDVDKNGSSDYVGFGDRTVFIAYGGTFSNGQGTGPTFSSTFTTIQDFGIDEGYTRASERGVAATGNGPGDTIYGQGVAGVYWYGAVGSTQMTDLAGKTYSVLQYQSGPNLYANFGSQEGWTPHNGFQIVKANVDDAYASIVGFGDAGIVVGPQAFAPSADALSSYLIDLPIGNTDGWDQQVDIRTLTDAKGDIIDLNHDGLADFVGMGPQGLVYAFGSLHGPHGYTLDPLQMAQVGPIDLGDDQGWNNASTLRDVVADPQTGFDDILAFGYAGVYVAMGQDPATHGGQPFGQLNLAMNDFGAAQGWSVDQTPRLVGDVNGDGILDIVGLGSTKTFVALGSKDQNGNLQFTVDPNLTIGDFGSAQGWSGTDPQTMRALGDVAGNGHSDLILSGAIDTQVWQFS